MVSKYLIIPAVTSLLFGACTIPFIGKSIDNAKQAVEQKAAEQAILKDCKYDQAICQYMVAQLRSFESGLKMTSTMTVKGKVSPEVSVTTMDGKGNFQSVSMKAGKETGNMVSFNNITYIKDYTDGKWMKMTSGESEENSALDVSSTIDELKKDFETTESKTVYTKIGQEACDKLTCDIYEMYEQGAEADKTKIWIDTKEHLTRKMEMVIQENETNTIVYSYEAATITEPSPVKEFNVPSIDVGSGNMPSQEEIQRMMQELPATNEYPVEESSE